MRKVLIVALGLTGAAAFAQLAFAKSACEEQRDACYSQAGQGSDKCAAEYDRCVAGDASAQVKNSPVATVPGLGAPMVQPYPASGINPPPALGGATHSASVRGAAGNLVKKPPPSTDTPPKTTASASSSRKSSGNSSSGGGGGGKPGSTGASTTLHQN